VSGAVTTVIDRQRGIAPRGFDLPGDRPAVASIDVEAGAKLAALLDAARGRDATGIVELALREHFAEKTAVISSFGAESVVLLHLVAAVDPATPILFLNTGKLFGETLRYRDRLQDVLGLTDIRSLGPHPAARARLDPEGKLWSRDTDACCNFRKVVPLRQALAGFAAHVTGRKRFQTHARTRMEKVEYFEGRFRFNPLCDWTLSDIEAYAADHKLPRHPLVEDGYPSIGCLPCTRRVQSGEAYRDGRWSGLDKDECGIHTGLDGEGI
jgi:phosphoadenosine phosphosulfate reductase